MRPIHHSPLSLPTTPETQARLVGLVVAALGRSAALATCPAALFPALVSYYGAPWASELTELWSRFRSAYPLAARELVDACPQPPIQRREPIPTTPVPDEEDFPLWCATEPR